MAANTLLTITMITREALRVLTNNLTMARLVNRNYDDKFGVSGAKIGTTLNVRKPPRYVGRTGQGLSVESSVETQVAVTLDTQFGVDIEFSSSELALSIDDFSERFIQPAVAAIANKIDADILAKYSDIYNYVGTPGTTPSALLTYLQAGAALNNEAAPLDGNRACVLTPTMEVTLVDALKGLFQQAAAIAEQYAKGQMGRAAGFVFYMDQNCPTHTVGPLGGTPLVNGANQTGATLTTDGWTASAANRLLKGDIFTIADVYAVNPQSRASTGVLRRFVVTADFDSSGAGAGDISISPSIVGPSQQGQTVNALPANNAAITVVGAANTVSPNGMAFHKDAFCLASADLPLPRGVDMAARAADKDSGISVRMVRDYTINNDQFPCRLDVLYGVATLRAELAARILG